MLKWHLTCPNRVKITDKNCSNIASKQNGNRNLGQVSSGIISVSRFCRLIHYLKRPNTIFGFTLPLLRVKVAHLYSLIRGEQLLLYLRQRKRESACGRAAHKFARCQLNGKGVKIRPKNTKTLGVYGLCRSSLRSSLMYKFICDKSSAECYMTCPFPHSTLKITKFYPRIDIANVSVISVALSQESKVHPETKDDVSFRDPKKGTSNNGQVIVMCFLQRS